MTAKQTLLSRLLGRQQAAEQAASRDFHGFVTQVADGSVSDPDAILDALQRLGETPESLQRGIDAHNQRLAWQEQLKGEQKTLERLREVEAKQASDIKNREQLREQWKLEDAKLSTELGELMAIASGYETIRAKLRESVADPTLKTEEKTLTARKLELHAEARHIRSELQVDASGYRTTPARLSNLRSMKRVAERQLKEAKSPKQKTDCEKEVAKIGRQIATTEKSQEPLHNRLERIKAETDVISREQRKIDEAKILVA